MLIKINIYSAKLLDKIQAKKIYIGQGAKMSLGYKQKTIDFRADIENYGELYFANSNVVVGDVYNFGKLSQAPSSSLMIKIKGDLYNISEERNSVILLPKENLTYLYNKGDLTVTLPEDIEFRSDTIFNFNIRNFDNTIFVSADSEFIGRFYGDYVNFASKNGKILNLKFLNSVKIGTANDFNLWFDGAEYKTLEINNSFNANRIVNEDGSELIISGKNNANYYIENPVINEGDITFKNNGYINSYINNTGVVSGSIAFGFEDKRKFKYIISENEVLTGNEKNELNAKELVTYSINLVPKLNEIGKKYFIHYILENETEEKKLPLKKDVENIETNFPTTNTEMPQAGNIPSVPEPQGDKTPPTISLNGNHSIELIVGKNYTELGATARDDIDGDLTDKIQITSNVDTNKIGAYQVSYEISDLAGNKTKKIRVVKVVSADQIPPVITLNGDESIELKAREKYVELGAKAFDETDGDLTSQIKIESNIDLTHTGNYEVKYSVSDLAGNLTEKIRTVKITEGNSSVGLPQPQPSSHNGKSGKKIKRSGKNGENVYVCKDSRAINFSNIGIHKEGLCIFQDLEKNTEKELKDTEKEKVDLAKPNQPSMEETNNQKQEKEKTEKIQEKQEKEKILLQSTCLNISSTEKVLKKWSKDKKSIKQLQIFLKKYGYLNGRIDGAFGAITHSALQNFQQDNKLYSDGIFGKGTAKWVDKNCRYIQKKKDEKIKEKEKEKEEVVKKKVEDFASQNPPQQNVKKRFNLEKKDRVYHQKYINTLFKTQEYVRDIKKDANDISILLRNNLREVDGPFESFGYLVTSSVVGFTGFSVEAYNVAKVEMGMVALGLENMFLDWEIKKFFFDIYDNSANKDRHDENKNTVIIIHGYQAGSTGAWVQEIANQLKNSTTEVLLLDWNGITKNFKIWNDTRNIDEVADKVSDKLIEWRIEPEKTRFIGHSLGSLMSAEISRKLKEKTGKKVKEIIALDPAASLIGTEYNINKTKNFPGFKDTAQNVKCFTGSASLFGSETKMNQCDEKILIDMPILKFEHGGTHEIYRQILKRNTLYNYLLSLKNTTKFKNITLKTQGANLWDKLELVSLPLERGDKYVEYGSEVDNEFSCEDGWIKKEKDICEFYGWKGDDRYEIDDDSKDIEIQDFRIERVEENTKKKIIDSDKLILNDFYDYDIIPDELNHKVYLTLYYKDWRFRKNNVIVTLKNVEEDEVDEWIETAKINKNLKKEKWQKTPIIIK